jgi:mannose-1-phosphate guanylyltransferase
MRSGGAGPWTLILAGGDGVRLRGLTRRISGDMRPKQYCALHHNETLLERARRRAALLVGDDRQVVVVSRAHEAYYRYLFREMSEERVVVQPENRGTAPGILYPLLRIARLAGDPTLVVLPSDHHVGDEDALAAHLRAAIGAVARRSAMIVLLGLQAQSPEIDYGWIEASATALPDLAPAVFPIRRFWEKPSDVMARHLLSRGCLWNSFMMVGRVSTFLTLMGETVPALVTEFERLRSAATPEDEAARAERLYAGLSAVNFSESVLARGTHRLVALPVKDVDWSDWGHPARVIASLYRSGACPAWLADVALDPAV